MEQHDPITEGDGYKSYVGACIPLLVGRRPVCLIDEPEMFLHPPHAYRLGRFIGRYGYQQRAAGSRTGYSGAGNAAA
jgi:hypothetical protein